MSSLRPALALILSPLAGCIVVVQGEGEYNDSFEIEQACSSVVLTVESGDVSVIRGDVDGVQVSYGATGIGDAPWVDAEVSGDTVYLDGHCGEGLSCGVDVAIVVPAGVGVAVETGSGDVSLSGLTAGGVVHTGSGDIAVSCVEGDWSLDTGSGDIAGLCLRAPALDAHTGSGDVSLVWSEPVFYAGVETGTGDVVLAVPRGAYDVDLDTGSGDVALAGIELTPGGDRVLEVSTGSGDIAVTGI